ncbi:MAG: ABC transporter permease [Rhodospirillales bacterium]|nr:ABC transporter permease [Rhodospirillales bacterium]
MLAVLLAIAIVNFLLIHLAPGDPATVLAGQSGAADPQFIAQLRHSFGLDRPLLVQLWLYLRHIAMLDLGTSYTQDRPVLGLILDRLPATLLLTGAAFAFALIAGIALGALAARRAGKATDTAVTILALAFYATPIFWVGLMLVLVFSVWLGWLPSFGMETVGAGYRGLDHWLDVGRYLILPALTLGLFYMAVYARLTRAAMVEVAGQDFIRTARAKGLTEGRILRRHILRNALLPVVTFAGIQAGQLIGGSVLVEAVFAWPGIGQLAFNALLARDYPVLLGVFLCTAAMVVVFNLATDLLYRLIDPRMAP